MVKVGWFSRHPFIPAQLDELKRLFGDDVQVRRYKGSLRIGYKDADEIINICLREGIRYAVVVLPLAMIDQLLQRIKARKLDIMLIRAEMRDLREDEEFDPYDCVVVDNRGRLMKFVEFREIIEIKVVTRPLEVALKEKRI